MQFLLELSLGKPIIVHLLLILVKLLLKDEVALFSETRLIPRLLPTHSYRRRNTQTHSLGRSVSDRWFPHGLSHLSDLSSCLALRNECLFSRRAQWYKINWYLSLCGLVVALSEGEGINNSIFLFIEYGTQVQLHLSNLNSRPLGLQLEEHSGNLRLIESCHFIALQAHILALYLSIESCHVFLQLGRHLEI